MSGRIRGLSEAPSDVKTNTVRQAAGILGVDREIVEGLVLAKKIKGYVVEGKTGTETVLVDREDLYRVARLVGRAGNRP